MPMVVLIRRTSLQTISPLISKDWFFPVSWLGAPGAVEVSQAAIKDPAAWDESGASLKAPCREGRQLHTPPLAQAPRGA